MDVKVQIITGLIPAVALLAGYLFLEKKHVIPVFCALFFILGAGAVCSWMAERLSGQPVEEAAWGRGRSQEDDASKASFRKEAAGSEENYMLVNALMAVGELEEAEALLRNTEQLFGYEPESSLARARLNVERGNFKAAQALYRKAEEEGILDDEASDEYAIVKKAALEDRTDWVLINSFPEYRMDGARLEEGEEAVQMVTDHLEQSVENGRGDFIGMAESIAEIDQIYDRLLNSGVFEEDGLGPAAENLNQFLKEYPALSDAGAVRNAAIKAAVLNGGYRDITKGLDRDSDVSEIMIASQLYLNGYVDSNDFSDSYVEKDKVKINAVRKQLQKLEHSLSGEPKKQAGALSDRYRGYGRGGAAFQLEQDLLEAAEMEREDSSKIYLQLAKMEFYKDNEEAARNYIARSFETIDYSSDGDYADAMYQVISLMGEKEDAESLKQLAFYTESVLENQLEVAVPEATGEFEQFVNDTAIRNRVSVSIMNIDASAFETVTAEFQFEDGSEGDMRDRILVEDCGVEITDYQIEKIEYDSARMLLCCDVSGSMSGKPIEDLRQAVGTMAVFDPGEFTFSIMAFNSSAWPVIGFTGNADAVAEAANGLSAGGGTNVFNAVTDSLGQFNGRASGSMDCIIVLSDGNSSDGRSIEDVVSEIRAEAEKKGVMIHCLGLGDGVDANYLESIARAAGGTYSYVSNSGTLSSFYQALQTRKDCSYRITYRAEDTLALNRTLKISVKGEEYRYDEKMYYLPGAEASEGTHNLIFAENKSIKGLDTRFLFRSNQDVKVRLLGTGFSQEDSLTVEMRADRSYKLAAEYVDETAYRLTIPASAACGTYDIYLRLNGKQAVLARELVIASAENERMVEFGPYKFTAYRKVQSENLIYLEGYATLNNWLHFRDGVYLEGNPKGDIITMKDTDGSYIQYRDSASMGLAAMMLKNNQVMAVPALGSLKLYRDDFHDATSDEYRVEYSVLPYLYPSGLLKISKPGYALYPYKIKLDFNQFNTEFPGQKKLFKTITDSVFQFDIEKAEAVLTGDNIGIKFEVSANEAAKTYHACQFGSWNIKIQPSGKVKINTLDNEYGFELGMKMMFFDGDGISLKANWHGLEHLEPYDFEIGCSKGFTKNIGGVPVTLKDFFLGAENFRLDDLGSTIWKGGCTASVANIGEICPKLKRYVGGDLAAASLEKITLSGRWEEPFLSLSATLKLLSKLDCGNLLFEVGNLSYTNQLLNMNSIDVDGLRVQVELGPEWSQANCRVKLRITGDVALTNRVLGFGGSGTCDLWFKWWIPEFRFNADGNVFAGFYTDHDNEHIFTVRGRGGTGSAEKKSFDLSAKLNK